MSYHQPTIVDIAQQVAEGQLPSNSDIKNELDPLKERLDEAERKSMGLPKAEAFHQTKELVDAVEKTLETKNTDDRLQKLVAAAARVAERTTPTTPMSTGQVWSETKEFVGIMKDLSITLISSKEFRKTLLDFFQILKDVTQDEVEELDASGKAKEGFIEGKPIAAANEIVDKATDMINNMPDEIPDEARSRLRSNLKNLLTQLNQERDTSHAFRKFIRLTSLIQREIAARLTATQIDKDIREVEELAVDIIDSFLEGKSIHQLIERIKAVTEKIQKDDELSKLIEDGRDLLERAFQNPELIDSDSFYDEADKLYDRSRKLVKKYQHDKSINKLFDEAAELLKTFKSDQQLCEIQYRMGKVADSMTYTDIKGVTHLDYDIIGSMRKEIVPFLIERINEIPIPGFRIQNEDFEYIEIKDLFCKLGDILPDKIHIRAMNDTDLNLKHLESPLKSESFIKFDMEGLRPEFKDFHFTFKKKGMIEMKDEGRATIKITGDGIYVNMRFELTVDNSNHTVLGKHKVEVKVDRIDIDVVEAEHKILLNMVSTLFAAQLKRGFEASLRHRFDSLGGEWAAYMNKRVLTALPTMQEIGSKITTAAIPPLQVLGETKIVTKANA